MEVKNGSNEQKDLEEDARNALLAHYSSKSTNQTSIILGLAIVFFTFVQIALALDFPVRWQTILFVISGLGFFVFFVIRAMSRLIHWGNLASAILSVQIKSKEIDDWIAKHKLEENFELPTTCLGMLSFAVTVLVISLEKDKKNRYDASWLFWRMTHNKWFKFAYLGLIVTIAVAALVLDKCL